MAKRALRASTDHVDLSGPDVTVAVVTIHDAPNMTRKGRAEVAKWLRRQAFFLEKHGDQLDKRFRSRYLCEFDSTRHGPTPGARR